MVNELDKSTHPLLLKLLLCIDGDRNMTDTPEEHLRFSVDFDKNNSYSIVHSPPALAERGSVRAQRTIKRLLKKFDEVMAEIMVSSGGVSNITFNHYTRLTPQPAWTFWRDMPDEEEE
jgi:hypothetical protein